MIAASTSETPVGKAYDQRVGSGYVCEAGITRWVQHNSTPMWRL